MLYKQNKDNKLSDFNAAFEDLEKSIEKTQNFIREEFRLNREEANTLSKQTREELTNSLLQRMTEIANLQKAQLDTFSTQLLNLTKSNEEKMENMRETIETRIRHLQDDNAQKLEKMRETVDEKLQSTLEKRLGESFKLVSERLEAVHQGLGDMQKLASGVGDLKKVLSNVKTKGILGEYQLENLLDQLLTPAQYSKNVKVKKDSNDAVEFAVKLPGRDDPGKTVWLPLDAKFPTEDYQVLMEAYEQASPEDITEARKMLTNRIRLFAKDISDKYIDPPNTTDFAIMFLPFEGLYAEVLRNAGIFESIQREFKVVITGPTTLSALLNSLQMGFRTLAIEKRSSEVWELLGAVKTEFGNFGSILEKTSKKLHEASNVIDDASRKSRTIERKLKNIQELPVEQASKLLGTGTEDSIEENENVDETGGLFQ
jgi:DNA recombination protein RmuC